MSQLSFGWRFHGSAFALSQPIGAGMPLGARATDGGAGTSWSQQGGGGEVCQSVLVARCRCMGVRETGWITYISAQPMTTQSCASCKTILDQMRPLRRVGLRYATLRTNLRHNSFFGQNYATELRYVIFCHLRNYGFLNKRS